MPFCASYSATPDKLSWNKTFWLVSFATLVFLVAWLSPFFSTGAGLKSYAPLHSALEIFAVVIAGVIFAAGWHGRLSQQPGRLVLLAGGFLGVALFDVAHILSFTGMPEWITPSGGGKAIYFWFTARYLAAFSILALVLGGEHRTFRQGMEWLALGAVLTCVAVSCWLVLWHSDKLPIFLIAGEGLTPVKIVLEWLLVVIALATLTFIWRKRRQAALYDPRLLVSALWLTALSELCFTLYSHSADLFNLMGHIYKVLSYGCLYQAIVVGSLKLPYKLLSESRDILQQLTDHVSQVFWVRSVDSGKILYVSPAYENIWQRSCQSLIESPQSWFDAIHPEDRERVQHALTLQLSGDYNMKYRIIRPDGSERWIRAKAFPVRGADGVVSRIAGVAYDITEAVEASVTLSNKERLLNQTQAIAHLGSWELNHVNNQLVWSDEVYRIFGLSPQEFPVSYKAFLATVHPEDRDRVDACYQVSLEQGHDEYEVEHRIIRGDTQEIRFVHEKCNHVRDVSGKVIRSIGMLHDITERKQAEMERNRLQAQLVQSQKMEAIGHLTGGIAHDFNNVLGAILGYAGLLKQLNTKQAISAKQGKYIDEILMAGNRAKELINQMLMFSRVTPQTQEAQAPVILLQPVVKEVVQLLYSSMPSTISVNYQIEDDQSRSRIQPVQFHQILLNLVINARDAIGKYGRINLNIRRRRLTDTCDACHRSFSGEYVELCVDDNGKGIPDHVLPKIFDPFFTTKQKDQGSGMGLAVVQGVVHTHGGHIMVASAANRGTTMCILLPAIAGEEESAFDQADQKSETMEEGMLAGLRIMVVDDEKSLTFMLEELLTMRGARVAAYNHPSDALHAFEQEPQNIDLVIADVTMPELSGLDMAKAMINLRPELPTILCTGYSDHANEDIAKQHGISGFAYKPFEIESLVSLIKKLCEGGA
ncbi:MAG: PAS domain-containing protein [Gammaproteobacteria bacterium]|nr:PAS domain-containing protein [Gammaproteobacteria bacterium]